MCPLVAIIVIMIAGEPVWTPYNRKDTGTDGMEARGKYVEAFVGGASAAAGGAAASASA